MYFVSLYEHEWELTKSPGGANQWVAKESEMLVPDAFDKSKKYKPTMLTTDLSLIRDSAYNVISRRFYENPEEFDIAFAKAWFKLTHRDMGPKSTYLGPEIPKEDFIWQDPIPANSSEKINSSDISELTELIQASDLSNSSLISTAWASASTYRHSDRRGGSNGARIALLPQKDWECNNPELLENVLTEYEKIRTVFKSKSGKEISLADLIIWAGNVGVEEPAKKGGYSIQLAFTPGRTDATQEITSVEGMAVLEPMADGFRNYKKTDYTLSSEQLLIDKAQLLTLSAPEMTVLLGGMRVLNANFDQSNLGVLTETPGVLNNAFFMNLCSMDYEWKPKTEAAEEFDGFLRGTNEVKWSASRADLIFGSNSELRAICEVYASNDANEKFITDFASAWSKVMNLDRFDI